MIAFFLSLALSSAFCKEYVMGGDPNVVAIALQDSLDDFALRIEAIKRAKHTIDVFTYMQTQDPKLGAEFLQALEDAIKRGVRVRYATEWLPNTAVLGVKAAAPSNRLLRSAFTSENCKLQVQCLTPLSKILSGFSPTDNFHEKILNIDAGTEHEIAWVTGRNNNDFAVRDLDFAIALRRIDRSKKSAISLLHQVFEDTWAETLKMQTPEKNLSGKNKKLPQVKTPIAMQTTHHYSKLKQCLFESYEVPELTFRPATLSVTTNSFFPQLRNNNWLTLSREGKMKSDNIDAVVRGIHLAKVIRMSLMSTFWPDPIKEALKRAVARGAKIEIFTNSETSDRIAVPGSLSFLYSSRDLTDLKNWVDEQNKLSLPEKAELKINVLNVNQVSKLPEFWQRVKFVHQKMIATDHEVFLGSDNYNQSSSLKNSEMQVRLTGKDTLKFFHSHLDEITQLFKPLECDALLNARRRSELLLRRVAIRILRPFF